MPPAARRRPTIARRRASAGGLAPVHWPPVSANADPPAPRRGRARPHDRSPARRAGRDPGRHRRLGRAPDLQRAREPRGDLGRHPRGAPGLHAARRRRQLARRHRRPRRPRSPPPTRGSGSTTGPASRAWAARTSTGSGSRSAAGAGLVIQMDADWSHDPAALPGLVAPIAGGPGGPRHRVALHERRRGRRLGPRPPGDLARRLGRSRGVVLGLGPHDLTGGFKAWRAPTLEAVPFDGVRAGGYVFQIEMTYRASRFGARVVEVPITFRDRRLGQSKMSRRIIVEALFVVISLRWDELRGRGPVRPRHVTVRRARPSGRRAAGARAAASGWSSTSARSRTRSGRRSGRDLPRASCSRRSPPTRSRASRSCCSSRRRPATIPTEALPGPAGRRPAAGCRRPGCLRSGALTADPLLLRGASVGAGWRAERGGAAGSVYHAAGGGLPILSGIPVVAALLDLAPWSMPEAYQRGTAARFGQRLRARILRDAAAVLVPGRAAATEARRLLRVRRDRIRVVPARAAARVPARGAGRRAWRSGRGSGLGARYAVYTGRYDARQDLPTPARGAGAGSRPSPAPAGVPGRRLAAAGVPGRAPRRTTAPRSRGPPSVAASPTCSRTRPRSPTSGSPGSSPGPGSCSSRPAPRSPASRRWRRSPRACR